MLTSRTMDDSDRLDSWKQIADYLAKSERTVRRWSEDEGLPVHRHPHQTRGSVWAYRHEIDAWLAGRVIKPVPVSDGATAEASATHAMAPGKSATATRSNAAPWLALAVAGIAGFTLITARRPSPVVADPVQLTALPGAVQGPSFSPDGRQFVFNWTPSTGAPGGLYIKAIGTEGVSPLVVSPSSARFDYSPAWSPDGKSVAFLRRTYRTRFEMYATATETFLCIVPSGGGPEHCLMRIAKGVLFYANSSHISWRSDSKSVYVPIADGPTRGIFRVPLANGTPVRITGGTAHEFAPALAPDSKSLIYMRQEGPPVASIERVLRQSLSPDGASTGSPREIFTGRSMSSGYAWLPGSRELIFCTATSALFGPLNSRLYRMSAQQKQPLVPIGVTDDCSTVAASPANASGEVTIVYGSGEVARANLYQAAIGSPEPATRLVPSSRFDALPSYSPDGSLIAFVSDRAGSPELWLARRDGTAARRLTQNSRIASTPRWSPDGSRIVYGSSALTEGGDRPYGVYHISVDGGDATRIPVQQEVPSDPFWSADGAFVYYWSGSELWRVRADGAEPKLAGTFPAHFVHSGAVIGDDLYYTRPSEPFALDKASLKTGERTEIAEGLASPFIAVCDRYVYYIRHSDRSLYAVDLRSMISKVIRPIPEMNGLRRIVLGLAVTPDRSAAIWATAPEQQLDLKMVPKFRP